MMMKNRTMKLGLITLLLSWISASTALAETPTAQLQGTIDRVVEVLRTIRSVQDIESNKGTLQKIILTRFDFVEMARRTLGNQWEKLEGKEEEFVSVFTRFIENSYFGTLGPYQGEKIVYGHERVDQKFAEVNTQVVGGRGAALDVDYRLHLVEGNWKVYDVVIDQVSLVSNYRSQFRRILQTGSLEELLKRLREKGSDRPS